MNDMEEIKVEELQTVEVNNSKEVETAKFRQEVPIEVLWNKQLRKSLGIKIPPRRVSKIGRNEPCPCGSGKKYKKCCKDGNEQNVY